MIRAGHFLGHLKKQRIKKLSKFLKKLNKIFQKLNSLPTKTNIFLKKSPAFTYQILFKNVLKLQFFFQTKLKISEIQGIWEKVLHAWINSRTFWKKNSRNNRKNSRNVRKNLRFRQLELVLQKNVQKNWIRRPSRFQDKMINFLQYHRRWKAIRIELS